jgi:uncharacterized protein YukE
VDGDVVMAEPLKVDPVVVHGGGGHVTNAAQDAARAFARHETELAEAGSGWVGESAAALRDFAAALAARHAADHTAITALGEKMTESAAAYANTDSEVSAEVASAAEAMGL